MKAGEIFFAAQALWDNLSLTKFRPLWSSLGSPGSKQGLRMVGSLPEASSFYQLSSSLELSCSSLEQSLLDQKSSVNWK